MPHTGQLIAVEVATVATLGAWLAGPVWVAAVGPLAVVAALLSLLRVRGKWAYEWVTLALAYTSRQRTLDGAADPAALLALAQPEAAVDSVDLDDTTIGILTGVGGPTAIIEIGDANTVLPTARTTVPPLAALAPATEPDQPAVRLRLVATTIGNPGTGPSASAYRQLTAGALPAYHRLVLAVQTRREPGLGEETLRHALGSTVRRVRRRLERAGVTARALDPAAATATLAELAHLDPAAPLVEFWPTVATGGWRQVTFRLAPDAVSDSPPGGLSTAARLLNLPGCAVTVAMTHENDLLDAYVRLAASTPAALAAAVTALEGQLLVAGTTAQRLDGRQLTGLTETLPLGAPRARPASVVEPTARERPPASRHGRPHTRRPGTGPPDLTTGGAGVLLGTNRDGRPVVVRLFRAEPTRLVMIGDPDRAKLVVLRSLAVGARLYLQTTRPATWDPFLRAIGGSGTTVHLVPPGRAIEAPPPAPLGPQLVVLDSPATAPPIPEAPWRTVLVLRDHVSRSDVGVLARADLALLTPMAEAQAAVAGPALGLGDVTAWLARIRGDMIGAIVPRTTVRWAMATPSDLERHLLGR